MKRNYNGWDAYDLPATTQKDYYGKAVVIEDGGNTILKSYNTLVCSIDADGNFHRHWYGYSRTTTSTTLSVCSALTAAGKNGGTVSSRKF